MSEIQQLVIVYPLIVGLVTIAVSWGTMRMSVHTLKEQGERTEKKVDTCTGQINELRGDLIRLEDVKQELSDARDRLHALETGEAGVIKTLRSRTHAMAQPMTAIMLALGILLPQTETSVREALRNAAERLQEAWR